MTIIIIAVLVIILGLVIYSSIKEDSDALEDVVENTKDLIEKVEDKIKPDKPAPTPPVSGSAK